jgi:hypothetical protein
LLQNVILAEVEGGNERLGGYDEHGRSKILEIDESFFLNLSKIKAVIYTVSNTFGGVERGSKKAFLVPV